MTSTIKQFQAFTGGERVQWDSDAQKVVSLGHEPKNWMGKLWNWLWRSDTQKQAYKDTTQKFIDTLNEVYGEEIGNLASAQLKSHLKDRKPLTVRRIRKVIAQAERAISPKVKEKNEKMALTYSKESTQIGEVGDFVALEFARLKLYSGSGKSIWKEMNQDRRQILRDSIRQRIANSKKEVTSQDAMNIIRDEVQQVVTEQERLSQLVGNELQVSTNVGKKDKGTGLCELFLKDMAHLCLTDKSGTQRLRKVGRTLTDEKMYKGMIEEANRFKKFVGNDDLAYELSKSVNQSFGGSIMTALSLNPPRVLDGPHKGQYALVQSFNQAKTEVVKTNDGIFLKLSVDQDLRDNRQNWAFAEKDKQGRFIMEKIVKSAVFKNHQSYYSLGSKQKKEYDKILPRFSMEISVQLAKKSQGKWEMIDQMDLDPHVKINKFTL